MNAPQPEFQTLEDPDRLPLPWADESALVAELSACGPHAADWPLIKARCLPWVQSVRAAPAQFWAMESLLQAFPLSSHEGLALMRLAEALLRVPDPETTALLLSDQLQQADFSHHLVDSHHAAHPWLEGISSRLLSLATNFMQPQDQSLLHKLGQKTVTQATLRALQLLGHQFVLAEDIEGALGKALLQTAESAHDGCVTTWSFDMLGEGARTWEDADRYLAAYTHALNQIADTRWYAPGPRTLRQRPGLSIKLSALHPRYEAQRHHEVVEEVIDRVLPLVKLAAQHDLLLTIDAEESHRLELQRAVLAGLLNRLASGSPNYAYWDGLGLAVQAYQLRARDMIQEVIELARAAERKLCIRLVKGAYWDAEIKRAQELGLEGYPVFTRKAHTDLSYLACAQTLLAHTDHIYPQFATHNAATLAAVLHLAEQARVDHVAFEFQRLHGMGERIYQAMRASENTQPAVRIYAPVGPHRDLLAYLVRRLLENGANASFVHQLAEPDVSVDQLLASPAHQAFEHAQAHPQGLPLPMDLYGTDRPNAKGMDLSTHAHRQVVDREVAMGPSADAVASFTPDEARTAMTTLQRAWPAWESTPLTRRCDILYRAAQELEDDMPRWMAALILEAKKTPADALAEVRETIDYARYYARQAQQSLSARTLPGPTGEHNEWRARGRGVWVCIAPWNFPLAIFGGQIMAALVAGNTVAAKPADQTPRIGRLFVDLLHRCGVPPQALICAPGSGADVGAALIDSPWCAGVAFTGSVPTAKRIQRQLALADRPILPLIAETGGINAMVVDSTALPEQVLDSVLSSAFGSAGQRCSALRLLCLHQAMAPAFERMLAGAMQTLKVGPASRWTTDVPPVVDANAQARLLAHIRTLDAASEEANSGVALIARTPIAPHVRDTDTYVAPSAYRIPSITHLTAEHFGPILHVVHWGEGTAAPDLPTLMAQINDSGFALTFGLHTRMDSRREQLCHLSQAGNVYVNRGMTGAVVGVQPFGGSGWSGTGPKAGGPHYLLRFINEQVVSVNTTAAGGNAALLTDSTS